MPMTPTFADRLAASRGFTLVESIIVLVVLGIAAAAIISLQGNIFRGKADNQSIQTGVQMMQACAEKILALKRTSGYSALASNNCTEMTNAGYVGTATYPSFSAVNYVDGSLCVLNTASPADSNCHLVTITLDNLKSMSLLLVN